MLESPRSAPTFVRAIVRFVLHYLEMVVAMMIGMAVLGIPVDALARAAGHDHLYHEVPIVGAVVMTAIMTGPMALWMAIRGHDRAMIVEMSLAMIVPVAGLIAVAVIGGLDPARIPFLTDPLMYVSMLAVMLFRWRMYAGVGHHHGAAADRALAAPTARGPLVSG